ncbi:hypothetical protein MKW92_011774 [Papaver armeniacum]|nr:hypothetical protein MKW92_011774 [Papaver armeniacum]
MAGAPKNGNAMSSSTSNADGGQYYPRDYPRDMNVVEETDTKYIYDVKFYTESNTETIRTTVPQTTSAVDDWIQDVYTSFARQIENNNLIVGLDIEWSRLHETSNTTYKTKEVAVLQLCLAHQCLIFQFFGLFDDNRSKNSKKNSRSKIFQKVQVPESLAKFLNDERIIFVGCGIDQDARKLRVEHGLTVARSEELAGLAEYKLGREDVYKCGLKGLMWKVLGQNLHKPSRVTLSRWDIGHSDQVGTLSYDQIRYACLDAYASFKIGMELMRRRPQTVNKGLNGYPQKDFNKAPQETSQGQGARGSYKESHRSKPTLMDYWK